MSTCWREGAQSPGEIPLGGQGASPVSVPLHRVSEPGPAKPQSNSEAQAPAQPAGPCPPLTFHLDLAPQANAWANPKPDESLMNSE